ncbi:MAG: ABC transporter permease [Nitrososphaerota archaeon]|nr:ABC transporter permease [Nitrososphaerota archaeon]MDG6923696.1 ABC transporter permease [Nitrososphaerota archaeon]
METPKLVKKRRVLRSRALVLYISLGMFAALLIIAAYALFLNEARVTFSVNPLLRNLPPSWKYPLGTDAFGRNLIYVIPIAIKNDLFVAFFAGALHILVGVSVGSVAAIFRGKVEEVLMRITDVFLAIPGLVLALAISGTLGHTFLDLVIALSVGGWGYLARITRSEVLSEMNKPYAEMLRVLGFSKARILFRHILRNIAFFLASVIFLTLSALVGFLAALEYIGFAIGSLSPELGALIAQGQPYIFTDQWLLIIPACFLIFIITTFMLISDEIRYFDPRKNV